MSRHIRTYSELMQIDSYLDRFEYLKLEGAVGIETFGFDRYLNQALYRSHEWRQVHDQVVIRDVGCDMAHPDFPIRGTIIVHHMNPITELDIENRNPAIFDPEFLVCVSIDTHNAIHYSTSLTIPHEVVERRPNDTRLW